MNDNLEGCLVGLVIWLIQGIVLVGGIALIVLPVYFLIVALR